MKTDDSKVKTYACTNETIISKKYTPKFKITATNAKPQEGCGKEPVKGSAGDPIKYGNPKIASIPM